MRIYTYEFNCWKESMFVRQGFLPSYEFGPQFGYSIAFSGTGVTLLVGAPEELKHDFYRARVGSVSVFNLDKNGELSQKIQGNDCAVRLGRAISISTDAELFLVVSDRNDDGNGGYVDTYR